MNRFRTKKKNKEEAAAAAASAAAAAAAASFTRPSTEENHSFMGFRRNKKAPEEAKEEIDLSNALPASDDFRTSLLMTGLSARFSMLREQDDPSTKIGKALDDSVLFPSASSSSATAKRQSRMMMDFGGFRGLDDIAEVESIRGMRPPPFMRTNSFASDTDSVGDSIMNRTRPTEGNNLFGGRQKIYRIPVGATSSKSIAEGGMGGRALYDDDVALSAFQKLRQEKKDQFLQYGYSDDSSSANVNSLLLSADSYEASSPYTRSESPSPIDYNLRRETSSTTSSGGARNSTAATSVASQSGGLASSLGKDWQSPPLTQSSLSNTSLEGKAENRNESKNENAPVVERNTTMRIRRLYEQGLNQDLHEQQNSALSRIDTLSGKRMLHSRTPDLSASASPSPTPSFGFKDNGSNNNSSMSNSPSMGTVTSTLERLERRQALAKSSSTNLRSISPPMSGSSIGSPLPGTISARTSSEGLSGMNMVGLGLNRKTSAAGSLAGSGPTSPPLSPPISESGGRGSGEIVGSFPLMPIQPNDVGKATAMGMFQKPTLPYDESRFAQRQLQLQQGRETPTERTRSDSNVSTPVANNEETFSTNNDSSKLQNSFLFDGDDDSNYDDNDSSSTQHDSARPQAQLQRPSDADHPAFRQQSSPAIIPEEPEIPTTTVTDNDPAPSAESTDTTAETKEPVDSPTLGPGGGLSGMVLQHLRSTSNASSVYSMASPENSGFDRPTNNNGLDFSFGDRVSGNNDQLDLKLSHPWDDSNNWTASIYSSFSTSESYPSSDRAQQMAERAEAPLPPLPSAPPPPVPSTQAPPTPKAPPPAPPTAAAPIPAEPTRRAPSLRSVSSRSRMTSSIADSNRSSSHTDIPGENEEDDFASQLANARRRVQERLTTYAESEGSRSNSPQLVATESSAMPSTFHLPSLSHSQSQSQPHTHAPASASSNKSNPLGILRAKSSRTSLFDRGREPPHIAPPIPSPSLPIAASTPQPKAASSMKMLGIGASTMSTSPSPSKQSFDEPSPQPAAESSAINSSLSSVPRSSTSTEADDDEADKSASGPGTADGNGAVHPGLLAFRNARRQLQKRKEIETLARHGDAERASSATPPPVPMSPSPAHSRSPPRQRRPTTSAKPPPVSYQQRDTSLDSRDGRTSSNGMRSRSGSRTSGPADVRDRSGSEASNNGYSRQAPPPRIRTTSAANGQSRYDDRSQPSSPITSSGPSSNPGQLGPQGPLPARPGMMPARSPGLPGTDIRRSPHMPPQAYPTGNNNNLSVQTAMGGRSPSGNSGYNGSAQPSPISPLGSAGLSAAFPGSNNDRSAPSTPTGIPRMMQQQQRPGGPSSSTTSSSLNDSMKRTVRKNEISEPTFVMSTSRVPTMSLAPQQQPGLSQSTSAPEMDGINGGSSARSRSNSRAARPGPPPAPSQGSAFVPPLPPINPLRKQSGSRGPRGILNGFRRTNTNDSNGDDMDTMSALTLPAQPLNTSASTSNLVGGSGESDDRRPPLRKQASEAGGMHSRLNQQRMDLPGGMI